MSQQPQNFVVFYDLPSEHHKIFHNRDVIIKAVQNARWRCGALLHELGLECTQSVILVAPNQNYKIWDNVDKVKQQYQRLQQQLLDAGIDVVMEPHVEVLQLATEQQVQQMTNLVAHTLNQKIDRAVERLSQLIDSIPELTVAQARRLRNRLPSEASDWLTIKEMAESYGIDTSNVAYVISLIQQAQEAVQ